jgi:hypothetical protein
MRRLRSIGARRHQRPEPGGGAAIETGQQRWETQSAAAWIEHRDRRLARQPQELIFDAPAAPWRRAKSAKDTAVGIRLQYLRDRIAVAGSRILFQW